MPELPEVETIRRDLAARLRGRTILRVRVSRRWREARHTRFHENRNFQRRLRERRVQSIDRRGKYLLVCCDGEVLIVHLGMSGQLSLQAPSAPQEPHTHAVFALDSGQELRFTDPRMFGRLWVVSASEVAARLGPLGPEPLEATFTWRVLAAALTGRRTPIKAALLDMRVVAGVGNIYSDEALFEAGVHPLRSCASLAPEEVRRLTRSLKSVLRRAVASRGTTLSDARYADVFGSYGGHVPRVYGREGEPCPRCRQLLRRGMLGNRGYHYCPRCQPGNR